MTKVFIIAEAGVNHNGDLEKAKKMIKVAAEAGADVVKFQTFKAEKLVSSSAKKAQYQQNNIGETDESQFNMLKNILEKFRKMMSVKNLLGIFIWVVGILYRIFIFV